MSSNPLFSTYRAGENRVTASMMAVFERIGMATVEALLGAAVGESELRLVRFENQWQNPHGGIPDAAISARFFYLLEVKTERDALDYDQLQRHLKALDPTSESDRVIAITPDVDQPSAIDVVGHDRLSWISFRSLSQAIDQYLEDEGEIVGDRERYLLRELQALFKHDGLLDLPADVMVVAASLAYPEYKHIGGYVCQTGKSLRQGIKRIAFYADGEIKPEVPRIRYRRDLVPMTAEHAAHLRMQPNEWDTEIADFIERWIHSSYWAPSRSSKSFCSANRMKRVRPWYFPPLSGTTRVTETAAHAHSRTGSDDTFEATCSAEASALQAS